MLTPEAQKKRKLVECVNVARTIVAIRQCTKAACVLSPNISRKLNYGTAIVRVIASPLLDHA